MVREKRGLLLSVLVFILLLTSFVVAPGLDDTGCYLYPNPNNDIYCVDGISFFEAVDDCDLFEECENAEDYFFEGEECTDFSECDLVTCTVNCEEDVPIGMCEALGEQRTQGLFVSLPGEDVGSNQEDLDNQCTPGCCVIREGEVNTCQEVGNAYQCDVLAVQLVQGTRDGFRVGVTGDECTSICDGAIVDDAVGEEDDREPVVGTGSIRGRVTDTEGNPVQNAKVFYEGTAQGASAFSNANGEYGIEDLVAGEYTLTASARDFGRSEGQQIQLGEAEDRQNVHFMLTVEEFQGIQGTAFVIGDDGRQVQGGVSIIIDGVARGMSSFAQPGQFKVRLDSLEPGQHRLRATFQGSTFSMEEREFLLQEGQVTELDLVLTRTVSDCLPNGRTPLKEVEDFTASHVQGEKAVQLRWTQPCPEVVEYKITRTKEGSEEEEEFDVPNAARSHKDGSDTLEWGETYLYTIVANYGEHGVSTVEQASIRLGNVVCEEKYDDSENPAWEQFCQADDKLTEQDERATIWTCSDTNQVVPLTDCQVVVEEDSYCSPVGRAATCKAENACQQLGGVFGLFHSRTLCYGAEEGEEPENLCYYDYTTADDVYATSIVDQCASCVSGDSKITSCFDYKSQDACETDNCPVNGECEWVSGAQNDLLINYGDINLPGLVTPETGSGYCVQKEYEGSIEDDNANAFCELCGPSATLLENYLCTAEVCSALGRCFSNDDISACESCPEQPNVDATCYSYNTELECTGLADTGWEGVSLLLSEDQCGWNRCTWLGGECVKDGNGDEQDDCGDIELAGAHVTCAIDIIPPSTEIENDGSLVVSLTRTNITVVAQDSANGLGSFFYCLTQADQDTCSSFDNFRDVMYPESLERTNTVSVNLLTSLTLGEEVELITGESYILKHFSTDEYDNQESVKESLIYVDTIPPSFDIVYDSVTEIDSTDLTISLIDLQETAVCTFSLLGIVPFGEERSSDVAAGELTKQTSFNDLQGIRYDVTVVCEDLQGNVFEKKDEISFDHDTDIDVIAPTGILTTKDVVFEATTTVGAQCSLYDLDTSQAIPNQVYQADFVSDETGKTHRIESFDISSSYPGDYHEIANYLVVCEDPLSGVEYEEFARFIVDTAAPEVQIFLREGEDERNLQGDNWEEFFIESVQVRFDCLNEEEGFPCTGFRYCLAEVDDSCRGDDPENFQEFVESFTLEQSGMICYHAIDEIGNEPFQIKCGQIQVEGFGIQLVQPPAHIYQDEMWGVSNTPEFTFQWRTLLNAQECRFGFSEGFEYDDVPPVRIVEPQDNMYTFQNFPVAAGTSPYPEEGGLYDVYIQCEDHHGIRSPQKVVHLEYDPTAPTIIEAFADPNPVVEGAFTLLTTQTDDKTLCRYDPRDGSTEYNTMRFTFPGSDDDERVLRTLHTTRFPIRFRGLTQNFSVGAMCANAAGDLSEPTSINFTVDYSQLGNIIRVFPSGEFLTAVHVQAEVETSKNAFCEFRVEDVFAAFTDTGGKRLHTVTFNTPDEEEYIFPIQCTMAGNRIVDDRIYFTIDRTPPTIENITDGNFTCGKNHVSVLVNTNDENISEYSYQIFDIGEVPTVAIPEDDENVSNHTWDGSMEPDVVTRQIIVEDTLTVNNPFDINVTEFVEGHKYIVSVITRDAAGNVGQSFESDGFVVSQEEFEGCLIDEEAPEVRIVINNSACTHSQVELVCDAADCLDLRFGRSAGNDCNATQRYNGQQLRFEAPERICYSVTDAAGNNATGERRITFQDKDGDGVRDSCDKCDTDALEVVDGEGCSNNDVPRSEENLDADDDQLPDRWENLYNGVECPLDSHSVDSDGNGVQDNLEDYDNDGFNNFDEYLAGTHPCVKDEPFKPGEEPRTIDFPDSPVSEEVDVLAWVLLIVGFLFVAGGTGYLVWFYREGGTSRPRSVNIERPSPLRATEAPTQPGIFDSWKQKFAQFRNKRAKKAKASERATLFGSFSSDSKKIPHVSKFANTNTNHLPQLQKLADTYVEHKDVIKPGLRKEEQGLFAKLENISKKTKDRKIHAVVDEGEAKDIFAKLRKLSKERK